MEYGMEFMKHRVCPWWMGYFLLSSLRKIYHNPEKILTNYIHQGMTVLDIGSGMGFFSIPMARMAGPQGKVICLDLQQKMLDKLVKRAKKFNVEQIIQARLTKENSLGIDDLKGTIGFALSFAVAHEVKDRAHYFAQIYTAMKQRSNLLLAEPCLRVSQEEFQEIVHNAEQGGFNNSESLSIPKVNAVLLTK